MQVTLIDVDPNPGGVCTFRGCIPSKALLHAARVLDEAKHATVYGMSFDNLSIDVDKLRAWKDQVIKKRNARVFTGVCDNQWALARKLLILNGEMLGRSIRHAWKSNPAARTNSHRTAPTHSPSAISRNNDVHPSIAINRGV
jgi:hypothetical protein